MTDQTLDETGEERDLLRVYPSKRLVVAYDRNTTSEHERVKVILDRNTSGIIVGDDTVDGVGRLFVTFERICERIECSYAFSRGPDGRFHFAFAPRRRGLEPPRPAPRSSDVRLDFKRHRAWPDARRRRHRPRQEELSGRTPSAKQLRATSRPPTAPAPGDHSQTRLDASSTTSTAPRLNRRSAAA